MRAAVVTRYGPPDVVEIRPMPTPQVADDHVLVRVAASSVNSGDARIRAARFPPGFALPARLALGLRGPRRPVLGMSFSGVVEQAGPAASGVGVGQEVCGTTGAAMGAHAELVALPAARAVAKPATVTHQDAAGLLFGGTTALDYLVTKAGLSAGKRLLVNGASGAAGTVAVQLGRHLGAHVTAVTSGANADLVRGLGADAVIDHRQRRVATLDPDYDVVLDAVGNLTPADRRLLRPGGKLLLAVASLGQTIAARGAVVAGPAAERPEHVAELMRLAAAGALVCVTDSTFELAGIAAAHRRVDTGHKVGSVVLVM